MDSKAPGVFFLKIFFGLFFLYSCSYNKKSGPYANIEVSGHINASKNMADDSLEQQQLLDEIFSPALLQGTLTALKNTDFTAEDIKGYLDASKVPHTYNVRLRFYHSNEVFSRSFLDSLVKRYALYRNQSLINDSLRMAAWEQEEKRNVRHWISIFEDSLKNALDSNEGFEHWRELYPVLDLEQKLQDCKTIRQLCAQRSFSTAMKYSAVNLELLSHMRNSMEAKIAEDMLLEKGSKDDAEYKILRSETDAEEQHLLQFLDQYEAELNSNLSMAKDSLRYKTNYRVPANIKPIVLRHMRKLTDWYESSFLNPQLSTRPVYELRVISPVVYFTGGKKD